MRDWIGEIDSLISEIDKGVKGVARAVRSVLDDGPYQVLAYRGYGNATSGHFYGRAQENRGVGPSGEADSTLKNLLNTYRRVDSNPLHFAKLTARYAGATCALKADDEGYFSGRFDVSETLPGDEWIKYEAELLEPTRPGADRAKGEGEILVPPPSARFGVISDIDDTVIQSRVSNFLQAARTVILGNARTRLPFPGVAAFYEALRNGATGSEKNPIFYVSSSPWNIYDVIAEFMDIQKIPKGPILLRDWDIAFGALSADRHFDHKGVAIRNIMTLYPELSFILIGDTSQHDPEIYRQIVAEFPERVRAIYIRDVTHNPERATSVQKLADEVLAAKSTLVLAEDTLGAAKHAVEQGWISADALEHVREEKHADEGRTDEKVSTPDGGKPSSGEAPTVIE
ncbi:MAG: phosphatase domain-containing protein [Gemmatimonadaceae bacterium]